MTFGVVPTAPRPATATSGAALRWVLAWKAPMTFRAFVEKPDAQRAAEFLKSGDYLWNSGMFLFRASRFLAELDRHAPDIAASCRQAFAAARHDLDFTRVGEQLFAACRSDSIDYAVMEKTDAAAVVPLAAGWSDVGSWSSLHAALAGDAE